jgi:sulfoxide reductase heme-binding subunit YedZ
MLTADSQVLWYLARGSGLVLLGLLTANLVLGIAIKQGWSPRAWPRFVVGGMHRNLALLAVCLLVVHVVTIELDPYVGVGWLALIVPFLSPYRPIWLGLGTLSVDCLIAVIGTSLLRSHLGPRSWRAVHWLAYLSWPVALLHSLGSGTDTRLTWVFGYELACLAAVSVAVLVRLWRLAPGHGLARTAGMAVTVALVGLMVAWSAAGPLQLGWSSASGSPSSLIGVGSVRGG